jgi:L,D-peptidoglycan transpeptidase YkuD (ErfK/YbiS/YcfS/YnhG family)
VISRTAASLLSLWIVAGCRPASEESRSTPVPSTAAPSEPASAFAPTPAVAPSNATVAPEDPDCPRGYRCDFAALASANPPHVTEILVRKEAHRLHLVAGDTIVRSYRVALGWGGLGQKYYEGDGTTPIGTYSITGKYPSKWHTYLSLDYPRPADDDRYANAVAEGRAPKGRTAGSAIAIHGHRDNQPEGLHKLVDWTLGCVALDNGEIDEVASLTTNGTRVVIVP